MSLTVNDDYGYSYTLDVANEQIVRSDGKTAFLTGPDQTAEMLNVFNAWAEDIPSQVANAPPPPPPDSGCGRDPTGCGGSGTDNVPVASAPLFTRTMGPALPTGPTAQGIAMMALMSAEFKVPPRHRLKLRRPPNTTAAQVPILGAKSPAGEIDKTDVTDIEQGPTISFDCYDLAYAIYQMTPQWQQGKADLANLLYSIFSTATTFPIDFKKLANESANVDNYAANVINLQVQLGVYARYYSYLGCFTNNWDGNTGPQVELTYQCNNVPEQISLDGGATWTNVLVRVCEWVKAI